MTKCRRLWSLPFGDRKLVDPIRFEPSEEKRSGSRLVRVILGKVGTLGRFSTVGQD
jgi:hypothetical protein